MAKHRIRFGEQIVNYHDIIVEYNIPDELENLLNHLPDADSNCDFFDYVNELKEEFEGMGIKVVETHEEVDWQRDEIMYYDDIPYEEEENNGKV